MSVLFCTPSTQNMIKLIAILFIKKQNKTKGIHNKNKSNANKQINQMQKYILKANLLRNMPFGV